MHLSRVTVRIREDNACRTLADSKTANVSYQLEAKNGFALWHESFLNQKRTPDSIYAKHHCIPPSPCVCVNTCVYHDSPELSSHQHV